MPATESSWRQQIVSVRDKNRLAQLAEIYTRPSSVQRGDWRAAETRHSSQVGHSLPACVTNTSSRVRDIRIISMWRDVLVFNVTLVHTQGWQVMHQENRCFIPGGGHWGGIISTAACMWFDIVCLLSVNILIGGSEIHSNQILKLKLKTNLIWLSELPMVYTDSVTDKMVN